MEKISEKSRCGYVALVGKPNVGKSTLLNCLVAEKVSITSQKPQTTRKPVLGISTIHHDQMVFLDTPGFETQYKSALNKFMRKSVLTTLADADIIVWVVEALKWREEEDWMLQKIMATNVPVILAVNKIDKVKPRSALLPFLGTCGEKCDFKAIIPISAIQKKAIDTLQLEIRSALPEGPHFFPDTQKHDENTRQHCAELIREQCFRLTGKELPYRLSVIIESFKWDGKCYQVNAIIWVETPGQKKMLIGLKGEKLKTIGTAARKSMEQWLGEKVFLRSWVKIKRKWSDDVNALNQLGFGEE